MPPCGPDDPTAPAVVSDYPGYNEVRLKEPLVGRSGQLLESCLTHYGLSPKTYWKSNAVLCQPPEIGRPPDRGPDRIAAKKAVKCCQPRLQKELANRTTILAAGPLALLAIVGRSHPIMKARGFIWEGVWGVPKGKKLVYLIEDPKPTVRVYSTTNPAFISRTPSWEPVLAVDVQRFTGGASPITKGEVRFLTQGNGDLRFLSEMGKTVGLDVETTKASPTTAELLCVGISDGKKTAVVVFAHGKSPSASIYSDNGRRVARAINEALARRTAITHNGPNFDDIVLRRRSINIVKRHDTLLAHHAFAGHMKQRLDHVASMFLNLEPWKIKGRDDEKGGFDPNRIPDEVLWTYNARDAQVQRLLWDEMEEELSPERKVYQEDLELALVARSMQERGILVDVERRNALDIELRHRMGRYLGMMRDASGLRGLMPTKLTDLRKAIFRILHAPVMSRTATGLEQTNAEVLQTMANVNSAAGRFSKLVLAWREAWKLRSTYVKGITVESDGAVHCSWKSYGTVSGRFAARDPNLTNLPRADSPNPASRASAKGIKEMYAARKGYIFLGYDTKQVEARVAAYSSGDEKMIEAVHADIHHANAEMLFGQLPDKEKEPAAYKRLRTAGKQANFAMFYFAEAPAVHRKIIEEGLQVSLTHVEAALMRLRRTYSTYYRWQEANLQQCQREGFIRTFGGRKRYFGHTPMITELANYPIQGGAADVINRATRRLAVELPPDCHIVGQVHDHLLIEAIKHKADKAEKIIRAVAEEPWIINGRTTSFPIEQLRGARWADV